MDQHKTTPTSKIETRRLKANATTNLACLQRVRMGNFLWGLNLVGCHPLHKHNESAGDLTLQIGKRMARILLGWDWIITHWSRGREQAAASKSRAQRLDSIRGPYHGASAFVRPPRLPIGFTRRGAQNHSQPRRAKLSHYWVHPAAYYYCCVSQLRSSLMSSNWGESRRQNKTRHGRSSVHTDQATLMVQLIGSF